MANNFSLNPKHSQKSLILMSNLNLECPFHHIELKIGESCPSVVTISRTSLKKILDF